MGNILGGLGSPNKQPVPPPMPPGKKSFPPAATPAQAPPPPVIPAIPVKDVMGGLGNLAGGVGSAVSGLMAGENWWVILLVVLLLFPDFGRNMLGGIFKGTKA